MNKQIYLLIKYSYISRNAEYFVNVVLVLHEFRHRLFGATGQFLSGHNSIDTRENVYAKYKHLQAKISAFQMRILCIENSYRHYYRPV